MTDMLPMIQTIALLAAPASILYGIGCLNRRDERAAHDSPAAPTSQSPMKTQPPVRRA
ncbi:hypothetical protein ACN27E_23320 [Mycobacterium sp. WMMD1722]|uniref:hypothetical protein n=1 Tax=Mycobacterium sp. WMMD1722 TaxID=3404117 RepID=UPI003BF54D3B